MGQEPSDCVRPPSMEGQANSKNIISVPMRYVRTNRGEGGALVAKSRLTLAGHTDPAIGLYRTDAPTTSHLAVLNTAVIAVSMDWSGYIFDVVTAFLTARSYSVSCIRARRRRVHRQWGLVPR